MNTLHQDKKVEILISALDERYKSIHIIRDRVQSTGIWILGILGSASAWIIQSGIVLSCLEKNLFLIGIIVIFIAIRFLYLEDLNKGFKSQLRTAAKLEKSLGFYESKFFNNEDDSMYPKSWEKAGTEKGDGKFFETTYNLIYIGFVFLFITILLTKTEQISSFMFMFP